MSEIQKPRADSMLDGLEEDQIRMLCEWLLTPGLSYRKARELCGKEFGVFPSDSQLSRFYQRYVAAELLARRRRAVSLSDEVADDAERMPGRLDAATIDALRQKSFELASAPFVNPKDVKALFSLVLKAKDQEIKERQVENESRKITMAEQAKAAVQETGRKLELSDAVLAEILSAVDRRITGLD